MELQPLPLADRSSQANRIAGLDSLRVMALILITWQHAASTLGAYAHTQWHGISPGQTGVGVFCAIAGFLAYRSSPGDIAAWLRRRLFKVFPAYWLVTLAAFCLALLFHTKEVTWGLFLSQMLGIGFFTHGWELVNVVSWFLSLILLCYLLSAVGWKTRRPRLFWIILSTICAALVLTRTEVDLSRHILAFALGALAAQIKAPSAWLLTGMAVAVFGMARDPQFFYAGFALCVVALAMQGRVRESAAIRRISAFSYEYFLVHGLFLVGATRLLGATYAAMAIAIACALFAALALQYLVEKILAVSRPALS